MGGTGSENLLPDPTSVVITNASDGVMQHLELSWSITSENVNSYVNGDLNIKTLKVFNKNNESHEHNGRTVDGATLTISD